jgi:enoyl-CoA hydratase
MIMTGRAIKPDEAERIGLINRIVDGDPIEQALSFSREFTCYSLPALGFARSAVTRALDVPLEEGLRIESDLSTLAFRMKDAEEGMAAFEQKRKPKFGDD